ncbi:MAG: nucleotidyl transferase AbiEii/AbiGii toxin family protein [Bacteroidota bacterium]
MIIELLGRVSSILEKQAIPYMLSGSVALGLYTVARTTRDIDIVVELNKEDVDKFIEGFEEFFVDEIGIAEEVRRRGMFNLIDKKTAFKIDFIIRSNSEYGQLEFSRRRFLSMGDIEFWVVSLEDLIIAKLRWIQDYQSDRQINDIKSLLLNPSIDWDYLTHWIQKLKLNTFNIFDNA